MRASPAANADDLPTVITFNMGTKDIRPREMKDVTAATDALPLPVPRLSALGDE